MLLNNKLVNNKIKEKNQRYLETNDNENITPNLWDTAKTVLRRKFIVLQAYLKKQEKIQINILTLYIKEIGKEQQT